MENDSTFPNPRRDFIKKTTITAAGFAIGLSAKGYGNIMGANDRIRVGLVGFSNRAKNSLLPAFNSLNKELNFEIVALSDIWSRRRDEGSAWLLEKTGKKIALARNNDEL